MGAIAAATELALEQMKLVRGRFTDDTNLAHVSQVATKHLTGLPYRVVSGIDWREDFSVWELQLGRELAKTLNEIIPERVQAIREMPIGEMPARDEEPDEGTIQTLVPILKEIFWLAWQACGAPEGMGFLQDRPNATKEEVWATVMAGGHDASRMFQVLPQQGGEFDADYIFGRMMKLHVEVKPGGEIVMPLGHPSPDYQSWAVRYKSYSDLLAAAINNLE